MRRREFLRRSALVTAGIVVAPAVVVPSAQAEESSLAFVDNYRTNVSANRTVQSNAAVRALAGMQRLWRTGTAWNNGVGLDSSVLRANVRHVVMVTRSRTRTQAKRAFVFDRQHQSYAAIGGLGPLADLYRQGAKAVTSITSAPDGTPPGPVDEVIPPGAPAGSALGAGAEDSALGLVVQLVDTLRGPYASGNPSKYAYQYPRPWRMTTDSRVVDTGRVDAFGYPVYDSDVVVAPQLLRQRSLSPADDAGYPSGHTNAFHPGLPGPGLRGPRALPGAGGPGVRARRHPHRRRHALAARRHRRPDPRHRAGRRDASPTRPTPRSRPARKTRRCATSRRRPARRPTRCTPARTTGPDEYANRPANRGDRRRALHLWPAGHGSSPRR